MKTAFLPISLLASCVAADTTACAAEAILDACLDTTEGYLTLCGSQDFSCLCDKYTAIMTCFANCPNDDRQYAVDSQRQLYCANASAFSTKTTTAVSASQTADATTTAADASVTSEAANGATTTLGNADSTATDSATPTGAADMMVPGQHRAGMLAAFAGVLAAALL
ncbi:hypothetical protein GGS24DRAFT_482197 [Hypoxylon argillaceum]|nr:hypothetical protein GGS24DRAFT_482197 [Hypoxylon argillaceum]